VGQGGRAPKFASTSGGTDLNGSFVGAVPWLPVEEGELQGPVLGMDVTVMDEEGARVIASSGAQGELVCRTAFPSAPLYFLGDDAGSASLYRAAYFDSSFAGGRVWRHGDFCSMSPSTGGFVIHGRSDATLNPGGVRIGTAELYRALDDLAARMEPPPYLDTLVVGRAMTRADGTPDVLVVLFLKLPSGEVGAIKEELVRSVRQHVREACSPRHVPAVVCAVADIPYTTNGKKVEIAVMRALAGKPVTNRSALANPESLDFFSSPQCQELLDELYLD